MANSEGGGSNRITHPIKLALILLGMPPWRGDTKLHKTRLIWRRRLNSLLRTLDSLRRAVSTVWYTAQTAIAPMVDSPRRRKRRSDAVAKGGKGDPGQCRQWHDFHAGARDRKRITFMRHGDSKLDSINLTDWRYTCTEVGAAKCRGTPAKLGTPEKIKSKLSRFWPTTRGVEQLAISAMQ